jgi:hypothetical protein
MICNECETVAHCMKYGCIPKQSAPDLQANADHAVKCATEAIADADGPIKAVREYYGAQPPAQEFMCSTGLCHYKAQRQWVGLTERELELIDGMIAVQLDHAARCDNIANRTMAEKQKGWDMERVALLQKLKEKNNG